VFCTNPATAGGLIRALRRQLGVEVVGVATSGEQAGRLVSGELPDVVLVEVSGQGNDGIDITRRVRSASPTTKVAMLTQSDTDTDLYDALMASAGGRVNRNNAVAAIGAALRSVIGCPHRTRQRLSTKAAASVR
jgi:two-component system NarL family response regulator